MREVKEKSRANLWSQRNSVFLPATMCDSMCEILPTRKEHCTILLDGQADTPQHKASGIQKTDLYTNHIIISISYLP